MAPVATRKFWIRRHSSVESYIPRCTAGDASLVMTTDMFWTNLASSSLEHRHILPQSGHCFFGWGSTAISFSVLSISRTHWYWWCDRTSKDCNATQKAFREAFFLRTSNGFVWSKPRKLHTGIHIDRNQFLGSDLTTNAAPNDHFAYCVYSLQVCAR